MFHMGNGEMRWKSRHGIAEDPVFVSIENPPLFGGQIVEAQETRTVLDILLSHGGGSACHPSRVVVEENRKTMQEHTPCSHGL
jgi:hypothetical protein